MATAAAGSEKIILRSSDGEEFEVDVAVVMQSQTIMQMGELDVCCDGGIPLPNVTSQILSKVIEYCKKHADAAAYPNGVSPSGEQVSDDELKSWDADFVNVEQGILFDLIMAANYLNIRNLLDLACQKVADMIKGRTPEEIRRKFNIENDFSSEEEEQVRRENAWAME